MSTDDPLLQKVFKDVPIQAYTQLKRAVSTLVEQWQSTDMWGISSANIIHKDKCLHLNRKTRLVNGSGNSKGDKDYFMPYCDNCGTCFPTEGRFRCSVIPINDMQ